MDKKKLLIVESPNKINSLSKMLGPDWRIVPTYGHIEDLPSYQPGNAGFDVLVGGGRVATITGDMLGGKTIDFGVDIRKGFKPFYVVKSKKTVESIAAAAMDSHAVYIATDPDREGEAIAYSVSKVVPDGMPVYRVEFNSITESEVREAVRKPRSIDNNLVMAAQARRVIDRLIGYVLSDLATKAIGEKAARRQGFFSVGRTQSPAMEMIRVRADDIVNFRPEINYIISAVYDFFGTVGAASYWVKASSNSAFSQRDRKVAVEVAGIERGSRHKVKSISKRRVTYSPPPPLITSTMFSKVCRGSGISAGRVMAAAQGAFHNGLITYPRTDSPMVSEHGKDMAERYIVENYGGRYFSDRDYSSGEHAQDSHECIRPVKMAQYRETGSDIGAVYGTTFKHFVASLMSDAVVEETIMEVDGGAEKFSAKAHKVIFDGFTKLLGKPAFIDESIWIPDNIKPGMEVRKMSVEVEEVRQPKPRPYDEAGLIEKLDRTGIGRPGTYADIIEKLKGKGYVLETGKGMTISDKGRVLRNYLAAEHPWVIKEKTTKEMETMLDKVAKGQEKYETAVRTVWEQLQETVPELSEMSSYTGMAPR